MLVSGVVAHLNIVITLFLIKIIVIIIALLLEIFTPSIGLVVIILLLASMRLGAFHLVIFTWALLIGFRELPFQSGLKFSLLGAIGSAIILKVISLGLLRWVLGRGRVLGVPSERLC